MAAQDWPSNMLDQKYNGYRNLYSAGLPVGKLAGNQPMEVKGKVQETLGKAQATLGKVKQGMKDARKGA